MRDVQFPFRRSHNVKSFGNMTTFGVNNCARVRISKQCVFVKAFARRELSSVISLEKLHSSKCVKFTIVLATIMLGFPCCTGCTDEFSSHKTLYLEKYLSMYGQFFYTSSFMFLQTCRNICEQCLYKNSICVFLFDILTQEAGINCIYVNNYCCHNYVAHTSIIATDRVR